VTLISGVWKPLTRRYLCKDETYARFLAIDGWKAAKYAVILVNMSHYSCIVSNFQSPIGDFFLCNLKRKYTMKNIYIFISIFLLSSCATFIKDSHQDIVINTYPDKANIKIKNSQGLIIKNTISPDVISLKRSDDSYFGSESYQVEIDKDGYSSKKFIIQSKVNNWYLLGNLFFGGLIGWFIVDPLTGRMYDLKPETINEILEEDK